MSVRALARLAFVIIAALPLAARAQSPAPSPPAACHKRSTSWLSSQVIAFRAAHAARTDLTTDSIRALDLADSRAATRGAEKMAADCAATFDVNTIAATQLVDLIPLYTYARDTVNAARAFDRMIAADLPPRDRARALLFAMSQEINRLPTQYGKLVAGAERYVAMIDQFPDSLDDVKLTAHKAMLGRYEYLDEAEGMQAHGTALMALARKLHRTPDMLFAYQELVRSRADRLQPDSALALASVAEKELGDVAVNAFRDFRDRYALIGTHATAIKPEWWINSSSGAITAPAAGRVTLIEFTAHWCGPCKGSYPGLESIAQRFASAPFNAVMVTQLYGYLGTQQGLSAPQELAADREYYGRELSPSFPVAVDRMPPESSANPLRQSVNSHAYRVLGIPEIVIIDKQGIIRQIVTGWDQENTTRIGDLIERLIRE